MYSILVDFLVNAFKASIIIGLIYGIGTIGLGLIYRYLKFPDFTTIASISIGSVVCVYFSPKVGYFLAIIISISATAMLGFITALQINIARIPPIIAGICTSVGALAFGKLLSNSEADISFSTASIVEREVILDSVYTNFDFIKVLILCLVISWLISYIFKSKYGLFIFALLGTEDFQKYHNKYKKATIYALTSFGNALIGLAGALTAIRSGTAYVEGHKDFLIIALGGFILGLFFVNRLSDLGFWAYLAKENKPSGTLWAKFLLVFSNGFMQKDEHPQKVFLTTFTIILSSALINYVFKFVELNFPGDDRIQYLLKPLFIIGILTVSILTDKLSTKKGF